MTLFITVISYVAVFAAGMLVQDWIWSVRTRRERRLVPRLRRTRWNDNCTLK